MTEKETWLVSVIKMKKKKNIRQVSIAKTPAIVLRGRYKLSQTRSLARKSTKLRLTLMKWKIILLHLHCIRNGK